MLRYLQSWIDERRMATPEAFREAGLAAAGSFGGHSELLPGPDRDGTSRGHHRKPQDLAATRPKYKNLRYLLLKAPRMAVTRTEFVTVKKAA